MAGSIPSVTATDSLVLALNSGSSTVKFALFHPETGERCSADWPRRSARRRPCCRSGGIRPTPSRNNSRTAATRPSSPGSSTWPTPAPERRAPEQPGPSVIGVGPPGRARGRPVQRLGPGRRRGHRRHPRVHPAGAAAEPGDLAGIEAIRAIRPELPQVAVFDTAFHHTMPPSAFRYAVPEDWYTRYGVRRYGFHGTSHHYVSERAAVLLGRPPGRTAPGHRPSRQRLQRRGDTGWRVGGHDDGTDPAGGAGHGDPLR